MLTVKESEVDLLAEMIANINRWLVALGWNAQMYHFTQELLRITLRGGDTTQLLACCQRWQLFIAPYMAQREEADAVQQFVNIVRADLCIDIQVVG